MLDFVIIHTYNVRNIHIYIYIYIHIYIPYVISVDYYYIYIYIYIHTHTHTHTHRVTIKERDTFNVVTYRESFLNVSVLSRALTWC